MVKNGYYLWLSGIWTGCIRLYPDEHWGNKYDTRSSQQIRGLILLHSKIMGHINCINLVKSKF